MLKGKSIVSLRPQTPILAISESNFSENSKPFAKRFKSVNQDPGGLIDERTEGQKPFPLILPIKGSILD
jgi:hypothetical protein